MLSFEGVWSSVASAASKVKTVVSDSVESVRNGYLLFASVSLSRS